MQCHSTFFHLQEASICTSPCSSWEYMPFADQRQLEIYVKLTVKTKLWPNQSMFKSHNHETKCTVKGDTRMQSFNRLPYCASPKKLFSPTVCPSTSAGLWFWVIRTPVWVMKQDTWKGWKRNITTVQIVNRPPSQCRNKLYCSANNIQCALCTVTRSVS